MFPKQFRKSIHSRCGKPTRQQLALLMATSLVCMSVASTSAAADPPGRKATADAATERTILEAQYAFRVDVVSAPDLDPVVFTKIVPFTAEEPAVRLPPDQDLD